jgi:hypothetical protein
MWLLALALLVLPRIAPFVAEASEVFAPGDFSLLRQVVAGEEGRLYRLRLGGEIYRALQQPSERDLAIFNADGATVPFLVRPLPAAPAARSPQAEPAERVEAPLFPIPSSGSKGPNLDVTVRTEADGRVVEVKSGNARTGRVERRQYLVDLSQVSAEGGEIAGYRLEIPLPGTDTVAEADVHASANLKEWRRITTGEPLVHLRSGERSVRSAAIEVPGAHRYLMLEVRGAQRAFEGVVAVTVLRRAPAGKSVWDSATFAGRTEGNAVYYDTGGSFPVESLNFRLRSPGIYPAAVLSRATPDGQWVLRTQARLSLILGDSGEVRNAPLSVASRGDRYWKLEFSDGTPSGLAQPPLMEVEWRPRELVFLAQGSPPYMLAAGSVKDAPSLQRPSLVRDALAEVAEGAVLAASMGAVVRSADLPPAVLDGAPASRAWQKYFVWGVFVVGALLFSWIAWRLLQGAEAQKKR